VADDRHSVAESAPLLDDPDEVARREAENGIRQFDLALEMIRSFVKEPERPFRLRSSLILKLHQAALYGIHPLAGTWRNTNVTIHGSKHQPPEAPFVRNRASVRLRQRELVKDCSSSRCIRVVATQLDPPVCRWQRAYRPSRVVCCDERQAR
jgi:hypothetical protein